MSVSNFDLRTQIWIGLKNLVEFSKSETPIPLKCLMLSAKADGAIKRTQIWILGSKSGSDEKFDENSGAHKIPILTARQFL